jgi:hypothetical protein
MRRVNGTAGLVQWWRSLGRQTDPLLPGEKLAAWIVGIAVALTRLFALSKTPWDWDEALFMSALRHFDVTAHHPHPPGFPLFIATGKVLEFAGLSQFHALQVISFLGSVAIVPAMVLLGRELRAGFRVTLISAVLLAFFPNVWFFGGTAFSDVPSMTLVIIAMALLLRGCRSDAALHGGAIVLAVAAAYRPQNLLIAFAPTLIVLAWSLRRRWRQLIVAVAVGAAIIVVSYGAAAHLSGGWARYSEVVHAHQRYITSVDSFRNPNRPALWRLFDDFFVRPYRVPFVNIIVTLLTGIGTVVAVARLRAPVLLMLASFGPFCVVAWLVLDHFSVSRFSIGYAPLIAFLAAEGLHVLANRAPRTETAAVVAFSIAVSVWIWPALREVRRHPSPPAAATDWIRRQVHLPSAGLYVHGSMEPLIDGLMPGFPYVGTGDALPPLTAATRGSDLFVFEGSSTARGARVFRRPRSRLEALVRDRYFEVAVVPIEQIITFADGWYDEEGSGASVWRWMGARARCLLPSLQGRGRLALQLYVPLDALGAPPDIDVKLNGLTIDRIHATTADIERQYVVASRLDAANELVLETSRIVNPAARGIGGDARDLGLRLSAIEWSPVQ